MAAPSVTARHPPRNREWVITGLLLAVTATYVSSFWGQAGRWLPAPISWWHDIYYRAFAEAWHRALGASMQPADATALYRTLEAYLLAFLVPLCGLWISGRRPSDAGLRMPASGTIAIGVAVSLPAVPIGFALAIVEENPWGSAISECLELAAMLPEHFLIFGVVMGLMFRERRLPGERRFDADSPAQSKSARFGQALRLDDREVFAVGVATLLFQVAHSGVSTPEAILALPVGVAFACSTLYAGSIWPALLVHWMLNLIPLAWLGLMHLAP